MTREEYVRNIVDTIPRDKNTIINASPRFGKTKCMLDIIDKWNPINILWVTPSAKLAKEDIPNEFRKWGYEKFLHKTRIITYSLLHKFKGDVDLLILDEAQCVTERNTANLFTKALNCKTIVGITGTPSKDTNKKLIYDALRLEERYNISIEDARNANIISDYNVFICEGELSSTNDIPIKGKNNKSFMSSEQKMYNWISAQCEEYSMLRNYKMLKMFSIKRMKFIATSETKKSITKQIIQKCKGQKTIIFCPSIEFAESICDKTYHSKTNDKDLKHFENSDNEHIAMVNAGGVGFTYKNVKNIIIVQADSNKNGTTIQKIARAFINDGVTPNIFIVKIKDTADEKWVQKSLEDINPEKIKIQQYKRI